MLFREFSTDSIEYMKSFSEKDTDPNNYLKQILESIESGKSFIDILDDLTKNYSDNVRCSSSLSLLKCLNSFLNGEDPPYSWYDFDYLQTRAGCLSSYHDFSGQCHSYTVRFLAKAYSGNDNFSDWITRNAILDEEEI